jgi:hypothetical protein
MDYSFDLLAIASGQKLYYWNKTDLVEVTDQDLGPVLDVAWIDGYFMTTDGEFLVVTELTDPTQVNPLKYGSSEIDPDPVIAIIKLRNEIYAINRNTIEVFDNVGGDLFPFQRIDGAQIQKGGIGTHGCCVFAETIAFLGSGRNEAPAIYSGNNATATKISSTEIDEILSDYTEAQLATVKLEAQVNKNQNHLYVHLPDKTLVFDAASSAEFGVNVWFILTSSATGFSKYLARDLLWHNNRWTIGNPTSGVIGHLDDSIGTHYGNNVRWEFGTTILYNEGTGGVVHELELVGITGRVAFGANPLISTSYSLDGQTWSQDRTVSVGAAGQRQKRIVWFQQGSMRNWRIQRFRGQSDAHVSFVRLEAQLEQLAY